MDPPKKHELTGGDITAVAGVDAGANGRTFLIVKREAKESGDEVGKGIWTTAQQNALPDSSFAYIEPGGEKDAEGKTTPRSLRHLPYKDASGKLDAPHVRNALARLNQTQISAGAKAQAYAKLVAAARQLGIDVQDVNKSKGGDGLVSEMKEALLKAVLGAEYATLLKGRAVAKDDADDVAARKDDGDDGSDVAARKDDGGDTDVAGRKRKMDMMTKDDGDTDLAERKRKRKDDGADDVAARKDDSGDVAARKDADDGEADVDDVSGRKRKLGKPVGKPTYKDDGDGDGDDGGDVAARKVAKAAESDIRKAQEENVALRKRVEAMENQLQMAEFAKRADKEIPHYAGTTEEKARILKRIHEGLGSDAEAVASMLRAGDTAIEKWAMNEFGRSGVGAGADAWQKIEATVNEMVRKGNGTLTREQAMDQYIQTPEGRHLYTEYEAARGGVK